MTPYEWARVLRAGQRGLTGDPAWEGMWLVLGAMGLEAATIAGEQAAWEMQAGPPDNPGRGM